MREHLEAYFAEVKGTIDYLPNEKIEEIINLMLEAYKQQKYIFVFGNGGSGATASHFAGDMNKGVCFGRERRSKVICLNDNVATMLAYANDVSYSDIFLEQLKNFIQPGDLVLGISGSGNSQNVVKAIEYANEKGAVTIGLTGFDGGELTNIANTVLNVPTDDMQKIEDVHLMICHVIMQAMIRALGEVKQVTLV